MNSEKTYTAGAMAMLEQVKRHKDGAVESYQDLRTIPKSSQTDQTAGQLLFWKHKIAICNHIIRTMEQTIGAK